MDLRTFLAQAFPHIQTGQEQNSTTTIANTSWSSESLYAVIINRSLGSLHGVAPHHNPIGQNRFGIEHRSPQSRHRASEHLPYSPSLQCHRVEEFLRNHLQNPRE